MTPQVRIIQIINALKKKIQKHFNIYFLINFVRVTQIKAVFVFSFMLPFFFIGSTLYPHMRYSLVLLLHSFNFYHPLSFFLSLSLFLVSLSLSLSLFASLSASVLQHVHLSFFFFFLITIY